jgi:hypothetical protein
VSTAASAAVSTGATAPTASTPTRTAPRTTPATPSKQSGPLSACLARNGIRLPNVGSSPLALLRSAEVLPKGVSRSRFEAVVRACSASELPRAGRKAKPTRITNPRVTAALRQFAACMRQNKINLPAPNTAGTGPVFDTKGLSTSSPQFRAALVKCSASLREIVKAHPGTGAAGTLG